MKKSSFLLGMSLILVTPAFGQSDLDLVPATNEDIQNFDGQLSDAPKPEDGARPSREERREERREARQERREDREGRREERKENFGQIVQEKAQELKDMPKGDRPQMGDWVSQQRRQNNQHGGGRHENGSEGGAGADSRLSAPSVNNEGKPREGDRGGSNRPPRPDRPQGERDDRRPPRH